MSALRWLYTVAAGFAVIRGVQTLAVNANGEVDIPWNGNLLVFVVFMSVLIRFSHGAIRHFYSSYEERNEGETWLWHEPLVDFFGLFAEACLFLLMAFSLRNHQQFTVFYFWLLAFDTLWLCLLPVKTDRPTETGSWRTLSFSLSPSHSSYAEEVLTRCCFLISLGPRQFTIFWIMFLPAIGATISRESPAQV